MRIKTRIFARKDRLLQNLPEYKMRVRLCVTTIVILCIIADIHSVQRCSERECIRRTCNIMGHSDYKVTMNTYTHLAFEDAQRELKRVNEQRRIG